MKRKPSNPRVIARQERAVKRQTEGTMGECGHRHTRNGAGFCQQLKALVRDST